MSLSSEISRNQVVADGVATVFNYTFKINDEDHIDVFLDDVLQGSGYTVTGVLDPNGGTIVFGVAPDNLVKVTMVRNVPYTQPTTYPVGSKFPAAAHEGALDYIVMQVQQLREQLDRAILSDPSSSSTGLTLPDPEADNILIWKDDLSGLENAQPLDVGTVVATPFGQTLVASTDAEEAVGHLETIYKVDTIAALKALDGGSQTMVMVLGYYAVGDNGGGLFTWDGGETAADNGGTIIAPTVGTGRWIRTWKETVTALQFGAKGDDVTDDSSALQAAIDWATANNQHFHIPGFLKSGTEAVYLCDTGLEIPANRLFHWTMHAGTLRFSTSVGANPGILFDSCMMTDVQLLGQIVYDSSDVAVHFEPTTNVPVDAVKVIVDSRFYFSAIVNTNTTASNSNVTFACGTGVIERNQFTFGELNGEGAPAGGGLTTYGIRITNPGTGGSTNDNQIIAPHIHNHTSASIQCGTNTTNATSLARNWWNVNCAPNATKDGFNCFGVKNYGFVNVIDTVGTPGNAILFQSSADNNFVLSTELAGGITDSSTTKENKVILKDTRTRAGITVGASPYTYQNTSARHETVIVQGGTISLIDFSIDNTTFYNTGEVTGTYELEPGDALKVTYSVLPTMNRFT